MGGLYRAAIPRAVATVMAAAAAAALLAACGGDGESLPAGETAPNIVQPGAPGEASTTLSADELAKIEPPRWTRADVRFMQGMIHHHAQALLMTGLVPARAESDGVKLLARRMEISQEAEIEQMQEWLDSRGQEVPAAHIPHGHAHGPGQPVMPGMLSKEELDRLGAADGAEFDRLFLEFMLRHHEGALTMVEQLYDRGGGQEPEADAFARHVVADQEIEIGRMNGLLAELR